MIIKKRKAKTPYVIRFLTDMNASMTVKVYSVSEAAAWRQVKRQYPSAVKK